MRCEDDMCPPTVAVTDVLASQSNLSQPFLPAVTQTRQQLPPSSCTGVTEVYVMITYFKLNLKQVDKKNPISPTFSCRGQSSPSETVRCRVDDNYFRWNKKAKWKQKLKQIHPFLVVVVRNPVTEAQCVNMGYITGHLILPAMWLLDSAGDQNQSYISVQLLPPFLTARSSTSVTS